MPFRRVVLLILFFAIVQFTLQVSLLARGVEYVSASLTIDDTYYYLQTAWNTKQLGFVTFDGLHATNGVQLLWFAVILLLALLTKTKTALLFVTLVVSFLLNGLCYLVILKISEAVRRPALALFMASLWSLQSLPYRIYSMGMENSLHALVFWAVIWQSAVFLIRVQDRDKPNIWGLTIVLILNAWTRLDSALLSAVLFSFCMVMLAASYRNHFRLFLQRYGRPLAGATLLAGLGLIVQLAAFRLMDSSYLPVSALVKTAGSGRGFSPEALDKLVEVFTLGMPSILQGRLPAVPMFILGSLGMLLVILTRGGIYSGSQELRAFVSLWSCLLVGEILYYGYVATSGVEYRSYFAWYRSPSFVFWILTASLLLYFSLARIIVAASRIKIAKWTPAGASLLIFMVAVYMFARSINFTSTLYAARYVAAMWIAERSPPATIFASWNTGQLAFFSNRTFINLDGVINSVDYYERVLRGPVPLVDYLVENDVDYLVDYAAYDAIPDFPVVQSFRLGDESGRSIQVWQVSPQTSSAP